MRAPDGDLWGDVPFCVFFICGRVPRYAGHDDLARKPQHLARFL